VCCGQISTGNTIVDLLLCMLLPLLLQRASPYLDQARIWWQVSWIAEAIPKSARIIAACCVNLCYAGECCRLLQLADWSATTQARTKGSKQYQREIMYVKKDGWYFRDEDEAPNNLLQQVVPAVHCGCCWCVLQTAEPQIERF
jgi:hypothetical protein